MNWLFDLFIMLMLIALAVAAYYFYKYQKAKSSSSGGGGGGGGGGANVSSYSTYYNGFWMYGMLAGYPTEGGSWGIVGLLNPANFPDGPPTTPNTNMLNYQGYTTLALAAGTYDPTFNMTNLGILSTGDVSNNAVASSSASVSSLSPIVMTYNSADSTYFNWGVDSTTGYLYNQGVGLAYPLVPTMESAAYPASMGADSNWPPIYMAMTFASKFAVDNTNYFAHTWSYGPNFQCVGPILPLKNPGKLSYANVWSCTVSLPAAPNSTPGSATTKYVYYLNASGTYYLSRAANVMNLGGPVMLVNSYQSDPSSSRYDTRNHMSFSMFWNAGSVCDLYSQTLAALQGGGGACQYNTNQCQSCNALIGYGVSNTATCSACPDLMTSPTCNQSLVNSGCVGYWYEFMPPAANPNTSSASSMLSWLYQ